MERAGSLGRDFGWLWVAYAASTVGTWLALDAFPLIAILVLGSGTTEVAVLSAVGLAVGALIAVPLAPWVEFHRKRPVMIAADLLRCAALLSLPVAYAFGGLTFAQLIVVSVVVAAGNIVFTAASGACLKALVRPEDLLTANGRFETTMWTATALGPPLGGVAVGVLGPLTTVVLDAVSYVLSALGIRAIRDWEPRTAATPRTSAEDTETEQAAKDTAAERSPEDAAARQSAGDIAEGWRHILRHPRLRPLFFNTSLVNGLIMATAPLLAVLMLRDLDFAPWQYGLAFGVPCLGGLLGSRLALPLVARYGEHRVMLVSGVLRACWLPGLAFIPTGVRGLVAVMVIELGLITCMGVFNPVFATYRLRQTSADRVARTLSAWTITSNATIAVLTVCWGLLASLTGVRTAIAVAGVLILLTPVLLPRRDGSDAEALPEPAHETPSTHPGDTPVLRP